MVAALSGLKPEHARHQILTSSTTPTMRDTFRRLLNMSATQVTPTSSNSTPAPSAFVAGNRKWNNNNNNNSKRPYCTYCRKHGHKDEKCLRQHGRPAAPPAAHSAHSAHVFQAGPNSTETTPLSQVVHMTTADYDAYLKYQSAQSTIPTATSYTGNPSACVTQRHLLVHG